MYWSIMRIMRMLILPITYFLNVFFFFFCNKHALRIILCMTKNEFYNERLVWHVTCSVLSIFYIQLFDYTTHTSCFACLRNITLIYIVYYFIFSLTQSTKCHYVAFTSWQLVFFPDNNFKNNYEHFLLCRF